MDIPYRFFDTLKDIKVNDDKFENDSHKYIHLCLRNVYINYSYIYNYSIF